MLYLQIRNDYIYQIQIKFCPRRDDALESNLVGTEGIIMMFITWKKQYMYMINGTPLIETSSTDSSDFRL